MTLTEFLLARIAEDEAAARAASPAPWAFHGVESVAGGSLYDRTRMIGSVHYEQPGDHDGSIIRHLLSDEADANGAHIARHDPARVLAECEVKRAIVGNCELARQMVDDQPLGERLSSKDGVFAAYWRGQDYVTRLLALPYAQHPDYQPEWAV